jgi:hypothetical protein
MRTSPMRRLHRVNLFLRNIPLARQLVLLSYLLEELHIEPSLAQGRLGSGTATHPNSRAITPMHETRPRDSAAVQVDDAATLLASLGALMEE